MYPNLPYPSEVYVPFDIFTAEEVTRIDANIKSLASGSGFNNGSISATKINNTSFPAPTTAPSAGAGTWTKYEMAGFTMFIGERNTTIGSWSGSAVFTDVLMTIPTGETPANLQLMSVTYSSSSGNLSLFPANNNSWNGNNTPSGVRYAAATATNFSLGVRYTYIKRNS